MNEEKKGDRFIRIAFCYACVHFAHAGEFGNPAYVPVCQKNKQKLPHIVVANKRGTGTVAQSSGVIPDWCPLEQLPNFEPKEKE